MNWSLLTVIIGLMVIVGCQTPPSPQTSITPVAPPAVQTGPLIQGNCGLDLTVLLSIIQKNTGLSPTDYTATTVSCGQYTTGYGMRPNEIILLGTDQKNQSVKVFIAIGSGTAPSGADSYTNICANVLPPLNKKVDQSLCTLINRQQDCDLTPFTNNSTVAILKYEGGAAGTNVTPGFCAYKQQPPFTPTKNW